MHSNTLTSLTSGVGQQSVSPYSPELLPLMQSLLKTLADMDWEFRNDIEAINKGPLPALLKVVAAASLKKRHHERRAPYLRDIEKLDRQIKSRFI